MTSKMKMQFSVMFAFLAALIFIQILHTPQVNTNLYTTINVSPSVSADGLIGCSIYFTDASNVTSTLIRIMTPLDEPLHCRY